MKHSKTRSKMKLISGGKQLSFIKDSEEVLKFLDLVLSHRLCSSELQKNRVACRTCFDLLSEEEDSCLWILENLQIIFERTLHADTSEIEDWRLRVQSTIEAYLAWSKDPFGWELSQSTSQRRSNKAKPELEQNTSKRTLTFPIKADTCIEVILPESGITVEDFKRLGLFLFPYCSDLDLTQNNPWPIDQ